MANKLRTAAVRQNKNMSANKKRVSAEAAKKSLAENPGAGEQNPGPKNLIREKILYSCLALLVILAAVLAIWGIGQSKNPRQQLPDKQQDSPALADSGTGQLIARVGSLMVLPNDEQPTVAAVTDLEKLKGQPFFAQAEVGDKVLIYPQAGKAILYRPSENKIVELAPLDVSANATSSPPGSQSQPLTVEIRNGSGKTGAAGSLKTQLEDNKELSVIKTGNAKAPYSQTLFIVKNPAKNPNALAALQKQLAGREADLPTGEGASAADVLIILGRQ